MKLALTDLRSLAVFRSVVEHNGFAGAQVALGLSQSAVSFHIKALEDRLGFRLCRRGRGGFELTDRGTIVHERSNALFLGLNAFESEVGKLRNRIVGTLRLGLVDNTVTENALPIPRLIDRICRRAPEGRVDIQIDTPDQLSASLAAGDLDAAILPETGLAAGIKASRLHDERHSLYCGASHPLYAVPDDTLDVARISAHPFVARPYANMRELRHFPDAEVRASASNMEAQAMFILSGHYLGYLPDHYAKSHVAGGLMRPLLGDRAAITSTFVIATRTGERASDILDLFVQELIAAISERIHLKGDPAR